MITLLCLIVVWFIISTILICKYSRGGFDPEEAPKFWQLGFGFGGTVTAALVLFLILKFLP
jgi:hypothetical protein